MDRCKGEGQGTCDKCGQRQWMCFLYTVNGHKGCYCHECASKLAEQINKPKAIVCDIDGCLLDVSKLYTQIFLKKLKGQEMWDYFHENANNSEYVTKIETVFNLVNMYEQEGYKIIILTARRDLIAKSTLHNLLEGNIKLNNISMYVFRQEQDEGVPSHIYKLAQLQELKQQYDIDVVIDDEYTNCGAFKQAGFNVLRVLRNDEAAEQNDW